MRRPALLLALLGLGLLVACEDDSAYHTGPSTFQNDTLDGAGAAGITDAAVDATSSGGVIGTGGGLATGTGGTTGSGGAMAAAGGTGAGGSTGSGGAAGRGTSNVDASGPD